MQEENKVKKSFFQNMKAELKKVIWPTGKQVVKNTFATIAFVLIISIALIVFNLLFEFLRNKLWYEPIFNSDKGNNAVITSGDVVKQLPSEEASELENVEESVNENAEEVNQDEEVENEEESVVTE